jgi:large subunit ribosomal protein L35
MACHGGSPCFSHQKDGRFETARIEMPKLKTKSGAKKRFKITASGLVKAGVAGKRHRLMSHSSKYIRQNRGTKVMAESDTKNIKSWMPYG